MSPPCKICGNIDTIILDERSSVPVAQNLLLPSREDALSCPVGSLEMRRCCTCGFVWNAAFDHKLMVYDATYDNDQNFSARFREHVDTVAEVIDKRLQQRSLQIDLLEVGCGQGAFMSVLGRRFGNRMRSAVGYDPAWRSDLQHLPSNFKVYADYFKASSILGSDLPPNVVVSRHVIEHVPDVMAFLAMIRSAVPAGTPIFIETPDVDWILRGGVFFDFYYEHCSLFSQSTLAFALQKAGFIVEDIRSMFDGQYQLATAIAGPASDQDVPGSSEKFDDLGFLRKRREFLAQLVSQIDCAGPRGSVALWGGASKGVTICLILPEASTRIGCTIDVNQRKQGCFLPTSAIPICGPGEAASRGIKTAIVVNPNYLSEISATISDLQLSMRTISIADIAGPAVPPILPG